MEYASFQSIVEQVGGLTPKEAEHAIEATLETPSKRITGGEAPDIAAFLPKGCADSWPTRASRRSGSASRSSTGAWPSERPSTPGPRPPTRAPCSWL